MLSNIRCRIQKLCELSWDSLIQLKSWSQRASSFSSFDRQGFYNPSLKIAEAKSADGRTLAYCPLENVFVVSAYAVSPNASPEEAMRAGDAIDAAVANQAAREGISKMLIVLPANHPATLEGEWRTVKVFERKIPATVSMGGLGLPAPSTAKYLN